MRGVLTPHHPNAQGQYPNVLIRWLQLTEVGLYLICPRTFLVVSGNTEVHHGLFGDQDLGCDHLRYNSVHSGTWVPMLRKDRLHIHSDRRLRDVTT
jgi:hypothetical protein